MPDRIFISYRREDTRAEVGRLADDLRERFGADRVFRDVVSSHAGRYFDKQIEDAIGSAKAFVAVIGSRWLTVASDGRRRLDDPQDWVRVEIAAALRHGVAIIPVLIEDATMPGPDELPEDIGGLVRIHARRVRDEDWERDVGRLVEDLERAGLRPLPPEPDKLAVPDSALRLLYTRRRYSRTFDAPRGRVYDALIAVLDGLEWAVVQETDSQAATAHFSVQVQKELFDGALQQWSRESAKPEFVTVASVEELSREKSRVALDTPTGNAALRAVALGFVGSTEKRTVTIVLDNVGRALAGEGVEKLSPLPLVDRWRERRHRRRTI